MTEECCWVQHRKRFVDPESVVNIDKNTYGNIQNEKSEVLRAGRPRGCNGQVILREGKASAVSGGLCRTEEERARALGDEMLMEPRTKEEKEFMIVNGSWEDMVEWKKFRLPMAHRWGHYRPKSCDRAAGGLSKNLQNHCLPSEGLTPEGSGEQIARDWFAN